MRVISSNICSVQMLPSGEKLQQLCDITNEKKLHFDFLFEFTGVVRSPLEIISDIHWYNTIATGFYAGMIHERLQD